MDCRHSKHRCFDGATNPSDKARRRMLGIVVNLFAGGDELPDVPALLPRAAALGIGRVVEVGRNGDPTALLGVLDRHTVDGLIFQTAIGEVGVVQADHRWPVARLLMDFGHIASSAVGPASVNCPDLDVGFRIGGLQSPPEPRLNRYSRPEKQRDRPVKMSRMVLLCRKIHLVTFTAYIRVILRVEHHP